MKFAVFAATVEAPKYSDVQKMLEFNYDLSLANEYSQSVFDGVYALAIPENTPDEVAMFIAKGVAFDNDFCPDEDTHFMIVCT